MCVRACVRVCVCVCEYVYKPLWLLDTQCRFEPAKDQYIIFIHLVISGSLGGGGGGGAIINFYMDYPSPHKHGNSLYRTNIKQQ